MESTLHIHRADGFYKFLALVGLVVAIGAASLAVWNIQHGQDRIFALQTEYAATSVEAAKQQAEIDRVQSYLDDLNKRVSAATDRGTPHYNFLVDESAKTTHRVEQAKLGLKARTDVVDAKLGQIGLLKLQRAQDIKLAGIVAGSGLGLTLIGLILWYWRVQRYLEIETQARMTKHLVEEIVTRSRTEAARSREDAASPDDDFVAVVSDTRGKRTTRRGS